MCIYPWGSQTEKESLLLVLGFHVANQKQVPHSKPELALNKYWNGIWKQCSALGYQMLFTATPSVSTIPNPNPLQWMHTTYKGKQHLQPTIKCSARGTSRKIKGNSCTAQREKKTLRIRLRTWYQTNFKHPTKIQKDIYIKTEEWGFGFRLSSPRWERGHRH